MKEYEPLIGEWHGEAEVPIDPPMRISEVATISGAAAIRSGGVAPAMEDGS